MDKRIQFHVWYVVAAIIGIVVLQQLWVLNHQIDVLPYSEYLDDLKAGKIAEVRVSGDYIEGDFKDAQDGKKEFVTTRVPPDIADQLQHFGVRFAGSVQSTFLTDLLSWILPTLLFFGVWWFVIRRFAGQAGGGFMAIGRSKAKVYVETDTKVTFDDVAGVDEAKEELKEIVDFLKDPKQYGRLGARIPKGVLLVGPPGTGKTLLARAVAGEAAVPFFSINGSEFVEMFVGVGAARVRDLFEQARLKAPAIIFIDELDALGRARGAYPGMGGHDEKEQTLNQLLVELDGFDSRSGLVLLAATNRPEILDPALLRAGRFDRQVLVDRPDKAGRIDILKVHLKGHTLAADVDPEKIAALTPGFTGADLANLVNEAALIATRHKADTVMMDDFTNAVERMVAGLEKRKRVLNAKERRVVAHHEMGHTLVAMSLPGTDTVHKVSIIPRGIGALGYTIQRPSEDRFIMTREDLEDRMAVLLVPALLHRRRRRPRQSDEHRPRHGGALRHGGKARPRVLRRPAPDLPARRAPARRLARAELQRRNRARHRSGGAADRRARLRPHRGAPRAPARSPGARRQAASGERDARRGRPQGAPGGAHREGRRRRAVTVPLSGGERDLLRKRRFSGCRCRWCRSRSSRRPASPGCSPAAAA
jgi:cell division protease FtsH